MAASTDPKQLSPKVVGAAVAGFIITTLGAAMAAISPEALEALGPWAAPVAMLIVTAGSSIVAWWRTDPLRLNYGAQKAAAEGTAEASYQPPANVDG